MNRRQKEICVGVVGANKKRRLGEDVARAGNQESARAEARGCGDAQRAVHGKRPKRSVRIAGLTIPSP